jgi:purine-binding chemotaxis protein CheW
MMEALLFKLGRETFALPLATAQEVIRSAWPSALPRAPFGCLGVLDIRGELVPLLDTSALLALGRPGRAQPEALLERQFVVTRCAQLKVCLLVDRVLEVGSFESNIQGTVQANGGSVLVLDVDALIGPNRQKLLRAAAHGAPGGAAA